LTYRIVLEQGIDIIVHFASILSALGEQLPELAIKLNTRSIENVLEVAKNNDVAVFSPSSIAAFGPDTPRHNTPDDTLMRPTTVYGITKVYTELLGEYYHKRYDVDFRSIRYPGVISSEVPPGGGTTDYAVDIYRQALLKRKYKCFLGPSTVLPMMHMSDCVKATMLLMGADSKDLTRRTYNVSGFSFSPEEQVLSIQKIMPDFECTYEPDFRQAIAESWPASLDDSNARKDWGWAPTHTIDSMSEVMLDRLTEIFEEEGTEIAGK
jgi:threonine 3-dehydrogenase